MAWRNVVITKHCKISAKMNLLTVQTDEDSYQFPLSDIDILLVATTRAAITTHAVSECMKRNIKIVFCDEKGLPIGETISYVSTKNRVANIRSQFNWEQGMKGELWRVIVQEKIAHQALVLKKFDCSDADRIMSIADTVKPGDLDNREAVVAHMYFPRLFSYDFVREDDTNPINGLLNYGYSIILSEVARQVSQYGYLNEIGIHHDNDKNPFNLACDLMEPFRPFVDAKVYTIENQELSPENKRFLIELLREEIPELSGSLSRIIEIFVRDSLRYLSNGSNLPILGFYK